MNVIGRDKATVSRAIIDTHDRVINDKRGYHVVSHSKVSAEQAEKIQSLPPPPPHSKFPPQPEHLSVSGYDRKINTNGVLHIYDTHGLGKERRLDQDPIEKDDFLLVPDIVSDSDKIEREYSNNGETAIKYTKRIDGREYSCVEVVSRWAPNCLVLKTMWKKKKAEVPHVDSG